MLVARIGVSLRQRPIEGFSYFAVAVGVVVKAMSLLIKDGLHGLFGGQVGGLQDDT